MALFEFEKEFLNKFTVELLEYDLQENNDFIVSLFKKHSSKYHKLILEFLLFIYNDSNLLERILQINIELLSYFKFKNDNFYPHYNELLSQANIKIIQKQILKENKDFIFILYELSEENKSKILVNDKLVLKVLNFNNHEVYLKYVTNIDNIINNITYYNIQHLLNNIFYERTYSLSLNKKQKSMILYKIKKYIHNNPQSIIHVEKLLDTNSHQYNDFLLECSQKNLNIWKHIPLNEDFISKICFSKKHVAVITKCIHFDISEKCLLTNIEDCPSLIHKFNNFNVLIVKKIILKLSLSNKKKALKYIINKFLDLDFQEILFNYCIVKLLLYFDTCYYSSFYKFAMSYSINFDLLCIIIKDNPCNCVLDLFINEDELGLGLGIENIENITEQQIYTLVEIYPNILKKINLNARIQEYNDTFISNCIKKNPFSITFFIDYSDRDLLIIDLHKLVYENTFIVEFIPKTGTSFSFKNIFKFCIQNISRIDSLFVSEETYNEYFLDACNAYFLIHYKQLSSDINREIYSYLV